ncbi:MAG: hypothetical protein AVDCRST_MAG28-161, partial [uncultured Rubrobacteraceae bacterium]
GPARTREHRSPGPATRRLRLLVELRELLQIHAEHRRGAHDRGGHEPLAGQGTPGQERRVRRQDHRDGPGEGHRLEYGGRGRHDLRRSPLRGVAAGPHTRRGNDELLQPTRRQGRGSRGERHLGSREEHEGRPPELRRNRRTRRTQPHGEL